MQLGHDVNFIVVAVSCRFTGFTHDRKYLKNHAKFHRIAIFTADDDAGIIKAETFVGCYRFSNWPGKAASDKSDKPKSEGVT